MTAWPLLVGTPLLQFSASLQWLLVWLSPLPNGSLAAGEWTAHEHKGQRQSAQRRNDDGMRESFHTRWGTWLARWRAGQMEWPLTVENGKTVATDVDLSCTST